MPITTLDYQLTDTWLYPGNIPCQNIYYFRSTSGSPSAQDLVLEFEAQMHPLLAAILASSMVSSTTEAFNLVTTTDFHASGSSQAGLASGDILASFYALGYKVIRADRAFRDSGKRYAGITEGQVQGNALTAILATEREAIRQWLIGPFVTAQATYELMIPKRVLQTNPNPPPAQHYVLNDLSAPSTVGVPYVTTQSSRKRL